MNAPDYEAIARRLAHAIITAIEDVHCARADDLAEEIRMFLLAVTGPQQDINKQKVTEQR